MCNLSFGSWSYDSSDFDLHFYDDMVSSERANCLEIITTSKVKMDLRQFGKYNQFKILKQDAIKEVTRYVRGYKLYVVHIKLIDLAMII